MISVLMSVYNEKEEWISEAIESILSQTYRKYEFLIVVDNPNLSPDCKKMLLKKADLDSRIKLLWNEKNIGLARSLNRAFSYAQGEYIARMDADDISLPERFEKEISFIESNEFDIVSANKINIDENGKTLIKDPKIDRDPNKMLVYSNILVHPLVMTKRDVFSKLGGYRILSNSEDYDLWLRALDSGYRIGILDEYLLKYRIRENSASVSRQLQQYYCNKYIVKLHKQRIKSHQDSYSLTGEQHYLKSRCVDSKIKRKQFRKSYSLLEKALSCSNESKNKSLLYIIAAFIYFPPLVCQKIYNYYKSHQS